MVPSLVPALPELGASSRQRLRHRKWFRTQSGRNTCRPSTARDRPAQPSKLKLAPVDPEPVPGGFNSPQRRLRAALLQAAQSGRRAHLRRAPARSCWCPGTTPQPVLPARSVAKLVSILRLTGLEGARLGTAPEIAAPTPCVELRQRRHADPRSRWTATAAASALEDFDPARCCSTTILSAGIPAPGERPRTTSG